ncbi:MAG: ribosome rescue protein RqcH [Candidatus Bathyarchaeia archaeon]
MKKEAMTSFDVKAVVDELQVVLQGRRIRNIYQLGGKLFLIRVSPGPIDLILELERRIHSTRFKFEAPLKPSNLCMELRKHLRNSVIEDFLQHEFERIVVLKVKSKEGLLSLIAEIFKRGNMILADEEGLIITAYYFAELKDRRIFRGSPLVYPPSTGIHPRSLEIGHLKAALEKDPSAPVGRAIAGVIPYPRTYLDEALSTAGIHRDKTASQVGDEELKSILSAVKGLFEKHSIDSYTPCIVRDEHGEAVDVVPIPLNLHKGMQLQYFERFNEAADEYFKESYLEGLRSSYAGKLTVELDRMRRILERQRGEEARLREMAARYRLGGDLLKANSPYLEEILRFIRENWRSGELISLLKERFDRDPQAGLVGSIQGIDRKNRRITLLLEGVELEIDPFISPYSSAGLYYEESKRLNAKLERLRELIRENEAKVARGMVEVSEAPHPRMKLRRELKWYERFRWFYSSEGLLVLSGRDTGTNSLLVERYMGSSDLVFHAEIHGSPFTIVKEGGRSAGEDTVQEAAAATASYSRAWREGLTALDVYWVNPDQVSRKAPSGEYLGRGMYMIYGPRNYVRGVPLRLAIGLNLGEGAVRVVGGPPKALDRWSLIYAELTPGDTAPGRIAGEVRRIFADKLGEGLKSAVMNLDVTEFQRLLPPGNSRITGIAKGRNEALPDTP